MQSLKLGIAVAVCALVLPLAAHAACVKVERSSTLMNAPTGSSALALWLDEGSGTWLANLPTPAIAGNPVVISDQDVTDVTTAVTANQAKRKQLRLVFVDAAKSPVPTAQKYEFALPAKDPKAEVDACIMTSATTDGGGGQKTGATVLPADGEICTRLADLYPLPKHERWVIFNSKGTLCATSYPLHQSDVLRFGLALRKGESPPAEFDVIPSGCTKPTGEVRVQGTLPSVLLQDAPVPGSKLPGVPQDDLRRHGRLLECESDDVKVKVKVDALSGPEYTLELFGRTTARLNVGVLNSKLRDRDFGLRAEAGGNVITDKAAIERGPEYVAMVVVQGLPHYVRQGYAYQGRDMVHDHGYADRLGLALSFGLKDPAKRFGLGLSFEVARGVSLVAVHEWVKRNRLDGVTVDSSFAGAAGDIPTRQEWAKGWSFGLSLDSAFFTAAFSGKK